MGGITAGGVAAAAAATGAAASVGGTIMSASKGASGQQQAAQTESAAQQQMLALASPYAKAGQAAESTLGGQLAAGAGQAGPLGVPPQLTGAALTQMPGYKFSLQQGLLSTQNAAAARGLGVSGAALMGAANYATGAAEQNYQNYFNDYWANQQSRYNMLAGLMTTGENAAVGAGSNLVNSAANIGASQAAAANTTAGGMLGATNTLSTLANNPYIMNALSSSGSTVNAPNTSSGYVDPFAGNTMQTTP